jgi:hypothetical protein
MASLLGLEDFDVEKDLNLLSERVGWVLGELTAYNQASVLFKLWGKDIKIIITPSKEVTE